MTDDIKPWAATNVGGRWWLTWHGFPVMTGGGRCRRRWWRTRFAALAEAAYLAEVRAAIRIDMCEQGPVVEIADCSWSHTRESLIAAHGYETEATEERTYVCAGCKRRVSWDNGADDDMPDHCDDCWAAAHEVKSAGHQPAGTKAR